MRLAADVQTLLCSFCRKPQSAVQQLVSSPNETPRAYICDECIAICASIVREDPPPAVEPVVEPPGPTTAKEEPPSLRELLEARLFEALEQWITREALYDDAAEELAELRSIASRWLAHTNV
jgi:hypothetical protein